MATTKDGKYLKRCVFENCDSNGNSEEINLLFIPFPKPCREYVDKVICNILNTNNNIETHDIANCEKCLKCKMWIQMCRRPGLCDPKDIKKNTYVCSKHFVNGTGPTMDHPNPLPATTHLSSDNGPVRKPSNPQKRLREDSASTHSGNAETVVLPKPKPTSAPPVSTPSLPVLSEEEEQDLVRWICELSHKGFPKKRRDVQRSVQEILRQRLPNEHDVKKRFGDADAWYREFIKRHPDAKKVFDGVMATSITNEDVRLWFWDLEFYLKGQDLMDIFQEPGRIFHAFEANFSSCSSSDTVFGLKGCKVQGDFHVVSMTEFVTVIFTVAATGHLTPPTIVYPYENVPPEIVASVPLEWGIGRSDIGWVTAEVLYEYIANILYPHLLVTNTKFPIVLFLAERFTNLTYQLNELCRELRIEILALNPNAAQSIQFHATSLTPFEKCWESALNTWRSGHPKRKLKKTSFADVLKIFVDEFVNTASVSEGFRECGLYPWNPYAEFSKDTRKPAYKPKPACVDSSTNTTAPVLELEEFQGIVGPGMLEKFREIAECKEQRVTEELLVLYTIWEKLTGCGDSKKPPEVRVKTEPVSEDETENVEVEQNSEINPMQYLNATYKEERNEEEALSLEDTEESVDFISWPETPRKRIPRRWMPVPFATPSETLRVLVENEINNTRKRKKKC